MHRHRSRSAWHFAHGRRAATPPSRSRTPPCRDHLCHTAHVAVTISILAQMRIHRSSTRMRSTNEAWNTASRQHTLPGNINRTTAMPADLAAADDSDDGHPALQPPHTPDKQRARSQRVNTRTSSIFRSRHCAGTQISIARRWVQVMPEPVQRKVPQVPREHPC